MHGSNALKRQIVVHHGEHTFLHFTAVPGVDDNLLAGSDVEYNGGFAVEAEFSVVGEFCLGCVVNNEVGSKVLQFLVGRTDEHVLYKVSLPCNLNDETYSHTGVFVGTAEAVYNIKFLVGKFLKSQFLASFPGFLRCGLVVVLVFRCSPPYCVLGFLVENNKFVFGRTAGVNACENVYCAEFGNITFLVARKARIGLVFEQFFVSGVVNHFGCAFDAVFGEVGFHFGRAGLSDVFAHIA